MNTWPNLVVFLEVAFYGAEPSPLTMENQRMDHTLVRYLSSSPCRFGTMAWIAGAFCLDLAAS